MKTLQEINQFVDGEIVFDIYGSKWIVWGWERPESGFPAHKQELMEKTIQLKDPEEMFFFYKLPQELIRYTDSVKKVEILENKGRIIIDPDGDRRTLTGEYYVLVGQEIINRFYTFDMPMFNGHQSFRAMGKPIYAEQI